MKRIGTLGIMGIVFLLFSSFSTSGWTDWSTWSHTDCFKKLDFRVKTKYSSTTKKYEAYVEFKNGYKDKINFNYAIKGGSKISKNNRTDVKSGAVKKRWVGASYTSSNLIITIDKVRFGKDGLQEYASCE